jgi:hypothetical protein
MTFTRKNNLIIPEDEPLKGRSQVGYSRRGFLGMLAAGATLAAVPDPIPRNVTAWISLGRDHYTDFPTPTRQRTFGIYAEEVLSISVPFQFQGTARKEMVDYRRAVADA